MWGLNCFDRLRRTLLTRASMSCMSLHFEFYRTRGGPQKVSVDIKSVYPLYLTGFIYPGIRTYQISCYCNELSFLSG